MKWIIMMLILLPSVIALGGNGMSENYQTYVELSGGGTNTTSSNYQNNLLVGDIAGNSSSTNYNSELGFWFAKDENILLTSPQEKDVFPLVILLVMMLLGAIRWKD